MASSALAVTTLGATGATADTGTVADTGHGDRRVAAKAQNGIKVQGDKVLRDGKKFVSRGVIFEGFQFPLEAMNTCAQKQTGGAQKFCQRHVDAQAYYFGGALDRAITNWHANTVRFNLGQAALDPDSALFKRKNADGRTWGRTYLDRVQQAVTAARNKGLVVELAVFNYRLEAAQPVKVGGRSINSYDPKSGLPTYRTKRAVERLAKTFKGDNEVLLEVYNEPFGNPDAYVSGSAKPKVAGVNTLVAAARAKGVKTPIIVQGPGADLSALPFGKLRDNKLIFSSHPFLKSPSVDDNKDWNRLFGNAARTKPVIITAWGARGRQGNWCKKRGPELSSKFLAYVKKREIGLVGFAFDVNGTMIQNFQTSQDAPTTFPSSGDRCAGAAGAEIQGLFAAYAG